MRCPKWPGDSQLAVQWILVVSPGGSIPTFGTKASRPAEHKTVVRDTENFLNGSLGATAIGANPISTP